MFRKIVLGAVHLFDAKYKNSCASFCVCNPGQSLSMHFSLAL